ncbi:DUF6350 family protein [Embleya sp. NBC_00896]|uniref:cell division protein PerM n=1 Tax=Embleya sp. NBC_00896 TaxID=2975961 RepID=UPI00386C0883|nr:DUF6350 family protein [Embleya sp. NBC_00896]
MTPFTAPEEAPDPTETPTPDSEAKAGTETEAETEAEAGTEAETEAATESGTGTEAEAGTEAETEAETEAGTGTGTDAGTETEAPALPPRPESPPIGVPPRPDHPPGGPPSSAPVESATGPDGSTRRRWLPAIPALPTLPAFPAFPALPPLSALPGIAALTRLAHARPDRARIAQALARGVVSGLLAAVLGLGGVALLVLIVATCGATSGGFDHPDALLRVVGGIWLAAHHVGFEVIEVTHTATGSVQPIVTVVPLRLAPLGLTVPLIWVLFRIGRRLADGFVGTAIVLGSQVLVYTGLMYAVAAGVGTESVRPVLATIAFAAPAVLIAGGLGAFGADLVRCPAVRAGLAAAAVLAAGGAVVVLVCLFTHVSQVRVALALTTHDAVGFAALALLCAALVPNAIVWAVSYAAGTGFALGAATTVAPTGTTLGALPTLPLFEALPGPAAVPYTAWAPIVLPALAGLAAGFFAARAAPPRSWLAVGVYAAGAGVGVGLLALAAARAASGTAGLDNLAHLGPTPWRTAAALAIEITVIAAPAAWITTWWRGRADRGGNGDRSETARTASTDAETALGATV